MGTIIKFCFCLIKNIDVLFLFKSAGTIILQMKKRKVLRTSTSRVNLGYSKDFELSRISYNYYHTLRTVPTNTEVFLCGL